MARGRTGGAAVLLLCCSVALAQQAPAPAAPPLVTASAVGPMEEVEVNAQTEKLRVMRAEMVKLEDQFYAKYNELNKDREYDILCSLEKPTGTHISQRVCRPVFVNDATEQEAREFLEGRIPVPSAIAINQKYPGFEKHMLAIINKSPELRKVARERERLEKRFEKLRKEKFGGKWVVVE